LFCFFFILAVNILGLFKKQKGIGSITTLTALALWRCQLVVYCPAKRSGAFASHHSSGSGGSSAKLGRVQAAILLTLIWTYSLAVTCPPLFGWGRYDREAAHIR
jgi:c-opsin